ncbi:hypothetical protein HK101_010571, partial [Irineochytrium annulatum]
MFEKSLTDLIRGIRANKKSEETYINQCLDEVRNELRRNEPDLKAMAIAKLFYLHMMGYDMSWASFHVIEVMSSPKYANKRIGYIAAAISFRQDTDVLMLCTNLIKKDLSSNNYLETALALNGLSTIVTPDLGRDLSPDLMAMLNHSRPYIRKRVIIVLYKVFLKYPETLRIAFPRLQEKLDDPDPSVVSAAVNVICELARRNPKSYLTLAPKLYSLLTNSSNNWMLIKIVKLFGALTPLEPRLTKKLVGPISNLIQSTAAMSLLYECIHTVITGGMIAAEAVGEGSEAPDEDSALARLCVSKLKIFVEDPDQNLKYLGLFALCKLLPIRPRAVAEHREVILECLEDKDISIRMRALELVAQMVTKRNVSDLVKRLMRQLAPPEPKPAENGDDNQQQPQAVALRSSADRKYALDVISRILSVCSRDTYDLVSDFEWYIGVLARLARVPGVSVGGELANQLVDISVRVKEVREFSVGQMTMLLQDQKLMNSAVLEENNTGVYYAASWVCGEYSNFLQSRVDIIYTLTAPNVTKLPALIQSISIHAALKAYAFWVASVNGTQAGVDFAEVTSRLLEGLKRFSESADIEVQERASMSIKLLEPLATDVPSHNENGAYALPAAALRLTDLFAGELNPVAPKAQRKVPLPEGLDLSAWIIEPEVEQVSLENLDDDEDEPLDEEWFGSSTKKPEEEDAEAKAKRRYEREQRRRNDPFYIPPSTTADVDSIPIVRLELDGLAGPLVEGRNKKAGKKGTGKKKAKAVYREDLPEARKAVSYSINRSGEMPDGAMLDDDRDGDADALNGKNANGVLDAETLAVMSVDFSKVELGSGSGLSFDANRAKILASDGPGGRSREVTVVRKKVGDEVVVKKVKKAVKKDKDGVDDGVVKKKKKKKKVEVEPAEEAGKKKKTKKKVVEPEPEPLSPPTVRAFNSPTCRTVYKDEQVAVSLDWTSTTQTAANAPHATLSISLLVLITNHTSTAISGSLAIQAPPIATMTCFDPEDSHPIAFEDLPPSRTRRCVLNLDIPLPTDQVDPVEPFVVEGALALRDTSLISTAEDGADGSGKEPARFTHALPCTINLLAPREITITPEGFADLLSRPANFPFSSSTLFPLPAEVAFEACLAKLEAALR